MFHPVGQPMERGWVGRIADERVVHLAAQTLSSFLTGGGAAREHAEYPLDDVVLLAPVLHPPSVRVFDAQRSFAFANPAAIIGPGGRVGARERWERRRSERRECPLLLPRLAALVGAGEAIAGFTALAEWRDPRWPPPKDRDFALGLGPVVVTPDELAPEPLPARVEVDRQERLSGVFEGFDWEGARAWAKAGTTLRAGDLLVGPPLGEVVVTPGSEVAIEIPGLGALVQRVGGG